MEKGITLTRMPARMRFGVTVAACGAALLLASCGTYMQRGTSLYHDGHYVEAAEVFERTEHRLQGAAGRHCAEYGLYRGLTLLALGDLQNSHHWLRYAYSVEKTAPGVLQAHERAMLDQGWFQLSQQLQATTDAPPVAPSAAVASQPSAPAPGGPALPTLPRVRALAE